MPGSKSASADFIVAIVGKALLLVAPGDGDDAAATYDGRPSSMLMEAPPLLMPEKLNELHIRF